MTKVITLLAMPAAAVISACGDTGQENAGREHDSDATVATETQPQANEGAPERAEDSGGGSMAWHFSRADRGPKLAYGVPQTDNVRLMLRCQSGAGSILLSFIRPASAAEGRPSTMTIAAGGGQSTVPVRTQPGPLGTSVEAELAVSAEPMQRWRAGRALEVRWGEETVTVPGRSGGEIDRFFDACV